MGRKSKFSSMPEEHGPYPCYFGCGTHLPSKREYPNAQYWEWFTGYGESTVHFCPHCKAKRQWEIDEIRIKLNVKPTGYPANRVKL